MIDLNLEDSSLKDCSWDKANKKYMTESTIPVKNFDKVKDKYLVDINHASSKRVYSNDALFCRNNHWYFVEFKNGNIDNATRARVKAKMYDSLLIGLDLLGKTILFSRESMTYIFVFNEISDHGICKNDETKRNNEQAENSKLTIINHLASKAKLDADIMLMSQYKGLYFHDVKVLGKVSFGNYLSELT